MTEFSPHGPFDDEERAMIEEVRRRVEAAATPTGSSLLETMEMSIHQLDRLGEVLAGYPSVFAVQSLGSQRRDISSLVASLTNATAANFEMFLPARALVSRTMVMGEVSFYRLLRVICHEALDERACSEILHKVDAQLCKALYTRLTETLLISIASDNSLGERLRNRAVLSLTHIWDDSTYRVRIFFPVLEATWDARRRVPATLGTLMGASEMFRLVQAGCDQHFVDYLARPDHTEAEAAAFREFLFGATTEQLCNLRAHMSEAGKLALSAGDVPSHAYLADAHTLSGDPALAMYEFFLSRHLQASARRLANLEGPKRTAEEYVMIHYLEREADERLQIPPST